MQYVTSRYSFEARSRVIGSSDATAIAGGPDDWKELYRQKTDKAYFEARRKQVEASIIVRAGRALEAVNLNIIGEKLGRTVEPLPEAGFICEVQPEIVSMPDGVYRDLEYEGVRYHGMSAVEVKACGGWQDAEERFHFYYPQIQHHILCMDAPGCLFGLMIGTTAHYTAYAGRDDAFIAEYLARCRRFLDEHLVPRVPPPGAEPDVQRYTIPEGIVPIVVDKSDDRFWRMAIAGYMDEQENRTIAEAEINRIRYRVGEAFRALGNVKMVKVDKWRVSLTKNGVVQFRNVDKDGE